jgi:tetratricopeptide (TPR) repeat protein
MQTACAFPLVVVLTTAAAASDATWPGRTADVAAQSPLRGRTANRSRETDSRLVEASTALYAGDADRTLQLVRAFLRQHPDDLQGTVLAARAHVARDEYPEAYALLRHALAVAPRDVDVLYYFGIVTSHVAMGELDRLYRLAPDGARVHQLMAESLKIRDNLAEAAAEYELALRASPNLLEALIGLAEIRREESKCDEAIAVYRRAQVVRPTYEAAYGLGVCFAVENRHAEAVDEFRGALKSDPRSAAAHFALGSSLLHLGETTTAIRELERAVALEPRLRQGYYLLGRAYGALGMREQSRQALARADELAQAENSGDAKALALDPPLPPPAGRLKKP